MPSSVRFVHVAATGSQTTGTNAQTTYMNNVTNPYDALYWVDGRDYATGIDAAFKEANDAGGIHGVPVERYHLEHNPQAVDFSEIRAPYAAALTSGNVYGTGGGTFLVSPYLHYTAQALGMPSVGNIMPLEEGYDVDASRHAINIRMSFTVEYGTLALFAVQSSLRCKRSGVLYFDGLSAVVNFGLGLREALVALGYETPPALPINFEDIPGFAANVTRYFKPESPTERPQCLFILMDATGLWQTLSLMSAVVPSFNATDYAIVTPSVATSSDWRGVTGYDRGFFNNLYSVSHFPNPLDARYAVSRSFLAATERLFASGYPKATVASVRGDAAAAGQWRPSYQAMEGYLIGRLFVDACRATPSDNFTVPNVLDTFYRQKRFVLDDWALGPYSDTCVGRTAALPYACKCNSGTRRLFMNKVNATSGTTDQLYDDTRSFEVGVAETAIPDTACSQRDVVAALSLVSPQVYVILTGPAAPAALARIEQVATRTLYAVIQSLGGGLGKSAAADVDIIPIAAPGAVNATVTREVVPNRVQLIAYTMATLTEAEAAAVQPMRGIANIAPLRYRLALKEDPLPPFARWNPYYMPVFSTLTDYANAAVARAVALSPAGASRVVIIADTEAYAAQVARTVMHHQRQPLRTHVLFADPTHATLRFGDAGVSGANVMATINAALSAATDADTILLVSQNVDALQHAFADRAGFANRTVVFVASEFVLHDALMELVTQLGAASVLSDATYGGTGTWHFVSPMATWHTPVSGASFADPAQAYSALVGGFVGSIAGWIALAGSLTPEQLVRTVYESQTFGPHFGNSFLGPFFNASCGNADTLEEHPGGECQCSRGSSVHYVRPLNAWVRALANDTASAAAPGDFVLRYGSGCGLKLRPLFVAPPDTTAGDWAIGSAAVLVAIVLLGVAGLKLAQFGKRDNTFAPKGSSQPFAIVFTDIQSSTVMWARIPQLMGPAVDAHHELIRVLIPAHRGYEVKTIGDSFMVAFASAQDAVNFACDLQSALYYESWGTAWFDETYKELVADAEQRRHAAAASVGMESTDGPMIGLAAIHYDRRAWNGLRVRVGVHYGLGDIKFDAVAQGYDYYGTVVNTAARVKDVAHGGQVVVTAAAVAALDAQTLEDPRFAVVRLGPQPLRGLDAPIVLTQVLPARFAARTFPPLRLDVDRVLELSKSSSETDGAEEAAGRQGGSTKGTVDDLIAHVVRHSVDTFAAYRRVLVARATLETLLSTGAPKWRESTVAYMADKWRIAALRKQPGMARFRRGLGAMEVDLVLLAYRVSTAADRKIYSDATVGTYRSGGSSTPSGGTILKPVEPNRSEIPMPPLRPPSLTPDDSDVGSDTVNLSPAADAPGVPTAPNTNQSCAAVFSPKVRREPR